jgi:hypothetical protein
VGGIWVITIRSYSTATGTPDRLWVDGRVVGGWAQRKNGEIVYELIDDVGSEASTSIESKAAKLQDWIGEIRVTPRFRSPHDKALTV